MNLSEKEPMIREALLQAGVKKDAKIVMLKKQGELAEIFVDDQYFNTYDLNLDMFTESILIEESAPVCAEEITEVLIFASIYTEKCLNDPCYIGAQLGLPASASDIERAFEQAGIIGMEDCQIEFLRWKDYVFDSDEISEASIEELNFFGKRIVEMDEETRIAFEGCLLMDQEDRSIKDLINLTYNLKNCRVLHDISNDAELGDYYAAHGLVKELSDIPETILAFIDYEKIGRAMRETENGIFLEGCYITNESNKLVQVYDGETLPKSYVSGDTFTVYISSDGGMEEKNLALPADEMQIAAFLKDMENIIRFCNKQVLETENLRNVNTPNTKVRGE